MTKNNFVQILSQGNLKAPLQLPVCPYVRYREAIVATGRQRRRRSSLSSREDVAIEWRMTRSARDDNAAPSGASNSAALSKEHRLFRGYRTVVTAGGGGSRMMMVMRFSRSLVSQHPSIRITAYSRTHCFYFAILARKDSERFFGGGGIAVCRPPNRTGHRRRFRYSCDSFTTFALGYVRRNRFDGVLGETLQAKKDRVCESKGLAEAL